MSAGKVAYTLPITFSPGATDAILDAFDMWPRVRLSGDGHELEGTLRDVGDGAYEVRNGRWLCGEHDDDGNHIEADPT